MAELFAGSWETVSSRPAPLVPASLCSQTVTTVTSRPCQVNWLRQQPGAREKVFVLLLEVRCEDRIIILMLFVRRREERSCQVQAAVCVQVILTETFVAGQRQVCTKEDLTCCCFRVDVYFSTVTPQV